MIDELRIKNNDTKNEVVAAYQEILHKLKETKKEPQQEEAPIIEEKKKVINILAKKPPEDYVKQFNSVKQNFANVIDELKEKFLIEQNKLAEVVEATESKNKELDELHHIEVNCNTLAALLMAQKEKKTAFEKEMADQRHEFEQHMAQQRREWQHEEQKYNYQRDLSRKNEASLLQDEYHALKQEMEEKRRHVEQEIMAQQRKFQAEMQERETRILAGERELQHLQDYKDKVAQFPINLQEAVHKAEEATSLQLASKFDYEAQLFKKEIKLLEQTILTLETKIALLESKIVHFETLKSSLNRLSFNMADTPANAVES
jgi:hypothetical protein